MVNIDIISNVVSSEYLNVFAKHSVSVSQTRRVTYVQVYKCSSMHLLGLIVIKRLIVLESISMGFALVIFGDNSFFIMKHTQNTKKRKMAIV